MTKQLINDIQNGPVPNHEIIIKCRTDLEGWQ